MSIPTNYQYRDCRGMLRHSWHEVTSDWANVHTSGVPFTVRCDRCGTERRDVLGTNTGEVVSRSYVYPVGYHIDAVEKPKIVDFRLAWLDDHMAAMRAERTKRKGAAK